MFNDFGAEKREDERTKSRTGPILEKYDTYSVHRNSTVENMKHHLARNYSCCAWPGRRASSLYIFCKYRTLPVSSGHNPMSALIAWA